MVFCCQGKKGREGAFREEPGRVELEAALEKPTVSGLKAEAGWVELDVVWVGGGAGWIKIEVFKVEKKNIGLENRG